MARKRLVNFYEGATRNYEVSVILKQTLSQEGLKAKLDVLKEIAINLGANVKEVAHTELKSYAYEITNMKKGYFACLYLSLEPNNIAELSRKLSIQEDVLRILVVLHNPLKDNIGVFSAHYEENNERTKKKVVSYDDPNYLSRFLGESAKIEPRKQALGKRIGGNVAKRQRKIAIQIKRARFFNLLPYIEE